MSLYTGKRLKIHEWTELHIDNGVIEQVEHFSSD